MCPDVPLVFSLLEKVHQPTMLELLQGYTPFQRLVMTVLSSRTRDATTIPLAKKLFLVYSTPKDFISVDLKTLEKSLYGVGFYRVKARMIKALCTMLLERYQGKVPETFEELTVLPGVGRKTANCVLTYVFGKSAIAVDTHVHRITHRLGWVQTKTPEETEKALQRVVPPSLWSKVNLLLVDHGQRVCKPLKPLCERCPIRFHCVYGMRKQ